MTKSLSVLTLLLLAATSANCVSAQSDGSADTAVAEESVSTTFEAKLMSFDSDKDGMIQKSELPSGGTDNFDVWDKDRDGALNRQEQSTLVYFQAHGELPKTNRLVLVNGYYRNSEAGPTVDEFVGRALSFDKNNDGSLDKDEIFKMAEAFVKHERSNRPQRSRSQRQRSSNLAQQTYTAGQSRSGSYLSGLHSQVQLPSIRSAVGGSQTRGRT